MKQSVLGLSGKLNSVKLTAKGVRLSLVGNKKLI